MVTVLQPPVEMGADSMGNAIKFVKINKRFPGAHVLKDVSFTVGEGEAHALIGENGAGKSTLLNILHGIYSEYEGEVQLFGNTVKFKNPNNAIHEGHIAKVHQETNVVKDISVGENITLGYEPSIGMFVDRKTMDKKVNEILLRLGCRFNSNTKAYLLSAGEMQMVAIAKALYHNARIISLDEPTASLSLKETENLFRVVGELKENGITVIYVSHRLEEIFEICDKITVLRDGEVITTLNVKDTNRLELIKYMVGRDVGALAVRNEPCMATNEILLKVENYSGGKFKNIDFQVHKGEILGFSGLVGAGRTELMRAVVGIDRKYSGKLWLHGKETEIHNTSDALKQGIGLLPEDRKTQGFLSLSTNIDNVAISSLNKYMNGLFVSKEKKRKNCLRFIEELNISPPKPEQLTAHMSGGNQQKVIISRWLSTDVNIIIFDEPTKGVDVGAKVEIYRLIEEFAKQGKAIIVISSELSEVIGISDRIIIMHEGKKTGELSREEFSEEAIMELAIGGISNE